MAVKKIQRGDGAYVQIHRGFQVLGYVFVNLNGTHIAVIDAGGRPKSRTTTSFRTTRLAGLNNADIAAGGARSIEIC